MNTMRVTRSLCAPFTALTILLGWTVAGTAATPSESSKALPSVAERFAPADVKEVPDFRRQVVPLLGRLGCNGRACHGSFQGRGGFRLSLFGYDFKMDHDNLTAADEGRVNVEEPTESLIIQKPTDDLAHGGGKRYELGSWEHHVLLRWIQGGAKGVGENQADLVRLEVTPDEVVFNQAGQTVPLKAVAVWSDGTREDVTPLCRFQTNDDQVAEIDKDGLVTAVNPGDTHVVAFYDKAVVPVPTMRPVSERVGPDYPDVPTPTKIDELVVQKLRKLGIVPSKTCTDAEFLRRISLDLTGTLPTAQEVEAFFADSSADKRARKIDELLKRPTYAAWWTTRLCDITGNNDDALNNVTPARGQASQDWYDWIYKRVADNVPYDELVAGIVQATSRNEGESYREYCEAMSKLYGPQGEGSFADRDGMWYYWARRNIRQPEEKALSFAYSFLGIRIQCAQCHKHPFDQWTQDDYKQFSNFFTRINFGFDGASRKEYQAMLDELGVKEKRGGQLRRELTQLLRDGKTVPFQEVYVNAPRGNREGGNGKRRGRGGPSPAQARLLGAGNVNLNEYDDPRDALMAWLRDKNNPYFARSFVNRVWAAYFGVGIVDPPDDLSLANPPSNRALLDYLTEEFIAHGYDMQWLHREITNSRTYQLSWEPNETNRLDNRNFSRALPRRLPAEVAYDAVQQATATDERALAMQQDLDKRAIAIPGASSRRRRNNDSSYFLTVFGKSARESNCDCDRSSEASLLQTVFLYNDQDMLGMIEGRNGWVNEVARELGVSNGTAQRRPGPAAGRGNIPPKLRQAAAQLRARIEELKQAGNEEQARKVQRRLAELRRRFIAGQGRTPQPDQDQTAKSNDKKPDRTATASADPAALIQQAYLRTLSRKPTDEELARARQYVESSEDVISGLRGLMWALLNTKEFIVNH